MMTTCGGQREAYHREGYGFTCDHFSLEPSVSGVSVNNQDRFDRARRQVEFNLRLGSLIKQALADVKVAVLPLDVSVIKQAYDRSSLTTNEQLTPGQTLVIKGQRLKIEDTSAAAQGVFLLSTQKNEEVKVAVLHKNVDKTLHAEVPESLKKGTYRLEVRTAVNKGKEVRTGAAPFILAVV